MNKGTKKKKVIINFMNGFLKRPFIEINSSKIYKVLVPIIKCYLAKVAITKHALSAVALEYANCTSTER